MDGKMAQRTKKKNFEQNNETDVERVRAINCILPFAFFFHPIFLPFLYFLVERQTREFIGQTDYKKFFFLSCDLTV